MVGQTNPHPAFVTLLFPSIPPFTFPLSLQCQVQLSSAMWSGVASWSLTRDSLVMLTSCVCA